MARRHVMTPARRAALRRAQLASAAKRRGKGRVSRYRAKRKARLNQIHPQTAHLPKRQQMTRRQVRNVRIGAAVGSAIYAGAAAYAVTSQSERKAAIKHVKATPHTVRKASHKVSRKVQTHRTNRQFKKIVAYNYSPKTVHGAKVKRKLF